MATASSLSMEPVNLRVDRCRRKGSQRSRLWKNTGFYQKMGYAQYHGASFLFNSHQTVDSGGKPPISDLTHIVLFYDVAAAWHIVSEVADSPGNGLGRVPCGVTGMYINGIYEESHTYPHILEIYRNGILKFLGIEIDTDATHFSPCECL